MTNAIVPGSLSAITQQQGTTLAESFLNCDAILIVDMSGSMGSNDAPGNISRYEAAERELRKIQAQLPGKVAVVAFSSSVQFVPGGVPPRLGGGTDMAGALRFVKPADGTCKFILISDGLPDDERETLRIAKTFESKIDTVYIGPETDWHNGRRFLEQLAAATGGKFQKSTAPGMLQEPVKHLLSA